MSAVASRSGFLDQTMAELLSMDREDIFPRHTIGQFGQLSNILLGLFRMLFIMPKGLKCVMLKRIKSCYAKTDKTINPKIGQPGPYCNKSKLQQFNLRWIQN